MKTFIALIVLLAIVCAKPKEDKVTSVPDMGNFTDFDFYSGYLEIPDKKRKLHYILVESENDPVNDPLVIWFNGGPGCSSMLGFAQEHGPYHMPDGDPNFYKNPNSWNKEANMLYIESPAGVGYSYFWDKDVETFDDTTSSEDNYAALLAFYEKFPEFKANDLFISGESYAGIYVPYLAWQIIEHGSELNLKGIIVGNGVTNYTFDTGRAYAGMGFWHSLYSLEMHDDIIKYHCKFANVDEDIGGEEDEAECKKLQSKFYNLVSKLNIYDVYRECYYDDSDRLGTATINGKLKTYKRGMTAREYTPFLFEDGNEIFKHAPPCVYATGPTDYLNRQDVRDALNVETDQPWELCVGGDRINYNRGEKASYWIYPILKDNNIRILHFSGNADGSVPTQGTRDWIHSLNWEKTKEYAPFYTEDNQVGGFVEYFDGITFASIQGIGHMASQWSPSATKYAVYQFIKENPIDNDYGIQVTE